MDSDSNSLVATLKQYPYCDPFSTQIPPTKLFPTEALVLETAALRQGRSNPVLETLNPFFNRVFKKGEGVLAPLDDSEQPRPLPEISLEEEQMVFIEKIYPSGRTAAYLVELRSTRYFLKVFRDRDRDEEEQTEVDNEDLDQVNNANQVNNPDQGWSMVRFRREKAAYEALLHSGACDRGVVPKCHGWFTLTREHVVECDRLTQGGHNDPEYEIKEANSRLMHDYGTDAWQYLRHSILDDRRRPKGILLEYFPHTRAFSEKNLTVTQIEDIAKQAIEGLHVIHKSHVYHGDLKRENMLILQDGSMKWVDFDEAKCRTETFWKYRPTQYDILEELAKGWSFFFLALRDKTKTKPRPTLQ